MSFLRWGYVGLARHSLWLCLIALPDSAFAANGIYTTGYGTVSMTMSGADLAIARDTTALATNPAGLVQIEARQWDMYATPYYTNRLGHADRYGGDEKVSNPLGLIVGGGYARRLANHDVVVGVSLNVQGGVGNDYEALDTVFGSRDQIQGIFSILKLSPGLAWRPSDRLSLGAALGITYAQARQKLFPNTSVFDSGQPEASFFGIRADGFAGWGVGARIGLQYQLTDTLKLVAAYSSPVRVDLEGGSVTVNYEALNLGRVRYTDAAIHGLELPNEAGLAFAWLPRRDLLLSLEATWFNWDASLNDLHLSASNPDGPAPVDALSNASSLDLKNQTVLSLGVEWTVSERLLLRAGYAYGRNPQPARTLSPVFALIPEHDLSLGLGYRASPQWEFNVGAELVPYSAVTYTNPQFPFGENAREANEAIYLHLMVSRKW